MTESQPTGYGESPDTADAQADLVDGQTGENASDRGERDTVPAADDATLTTDDEAQRDDLPTRPGNAAS